MHAVHGNGMGMRRSAGTLQVLALALVLAQGMASCGGGEEAGAIKRPQVTGVTLTGIAPVEVDEVFETTGTVRSDSTGTIASRVMGTITSLEVREGDIVQAGQLLLTIDDRDAKDRVRAAETALDAARQNRNLARVTEKRYRNLFEQKALSRQEMDQIETSRKVAEAEVSRAAAMAGEARTSLNFTRINAPFSGRVVEKKVDAGSMAAPGVPLLVIEAEGSRYVEAGFDESLSSTLAVGMPAQVVIDSLNKTIAGSIREIVPAVDPGSRTFRAKIPLEEPGLASGMFARVKITVGKRKAILVPPAAVVRKGQLEGVYVADPQGVLTYRLVKTGRVMPRGVEILSGLSAQERIVTGGIERAVDGGIVASGAHK